jgi:hypothetical protein
MVETDGGVTNYCALLLVIVINDPASKQEKQIDGMNADAEGKSR